MNTRLTRRSMLSLLATVPFATAFSPRAHASSTAESVFGDRSLPILGNPEGDVTIAVWFDYQCPFCKKTEPDLMRAVQTDGKVKLLLKDWPIFGDASMQAARAVWSSRRQGRLENAHAALMQTPGRIAPQRIEPILATAGIDLVALGRDIATDRSDFDGLMARNNEQAEAFGFRGTPAFVIGSFVFPGVLDEAGFTQVIGDVRRARKG